MLRLIAFAFIVSFTSQAALAQEPAKRAPTPQESLAEYDRLQTELREKIEEHARLLAEQAEVKRIAAENLAVPSHPEFPGAGATRTLGGLTADWRVMWKEGQLVGNTNSQMRLRLRLDRVRSRPGVDAALRRREAAHAAASAAQTAASADKPF